MARTPARDIDLCGEEAIIMTVEEIAIQEPSSHGAKRNLLKAGFSLDRHWCGTEYWQRLRSID